MNYLINITWKQTEQKGDQRKPTSHGQLYQRQPSVLPLAHDIFRTKHFIARIRVQSNATS